MEIDYSMGGRCPKKAGGGKGKRRRHRGGPERCKLQLGRIARALVAPVTLPFGYAVRLRRSLAHLGRGRGGACLAGRRSASIHTKFSSSRSLTRRSRSSAISNWHTSTLLVLALLRPRGWRNTFSVGCCGLRFVMVGSPRRDPARNQAHNSVCR